MKAYCDNCKDTKPAFFDLCHDAKTGEPFEDLVCYDCHSIIACITDRTDTLAAKVRELEEENRSLKDYNPFVSAAIGHETKRAEKAEAELAAVKERNAELEHTLSVAINRVKVLQLL